VTDEPNEVSYTGDVAQTERAARRAVVEPRPPTISELRLTVGDGFKFGCGLMMAVGIALLAGLLALSIGFLLASLLGIPLPIA